MPIKSNNSATRQIAVEIGSSVLRVVDVHRDVPNRRAEVRTHAIPWRDRSQVLHSEEGARELTAALQQLAAREHLTGARLRIALNGDYCVTRVVTGSEQRVKREISALEERSQLYLSLGPGRKALAGSVHQIDARHQHALLTVSNQKTLDALLQVAATVGIHIELIEPSLVAISRLMDHLGYDHDAPVMIAYVSERGVELGITYRGQLLLDYRPGGRSVGDELPRIIRTHLARLRRYCQRYFRFAQGDLEHIYLCGTDRETEAIRARFGGADDRLEVHSLELSELGAGWRFEGPTSGDFSAALGTALLSPTSLDRAGPNLIEEMTKHVGPPLIPMLLRALWPVAAVLLLAAGLGLVVAREQSGLNELEQQQQALEPATSEARELRLTLARSESHTQHLQIVDRQLHHPPWHKVLELLSGSMPDDLWLDALHLRRPGELVMTGASFDEESIYEFVRWLDRAALLKNVALVGTSPGKFRSGKAVKFELRCELADSSGGEERGGGDA